MALTSFHPVNDRLRVTAARFCTTQRDADAEIYFSIHEIWGLHDAESMAQGKICLASAATSIHEISDATILVDPMIHMSMQGLSK